MYQNSNQHKINLRKARQKANSLKCNCTFCNKTTNKANIKKHEQSCYLNPINKKLCPVCDAPIVNYRISTTCGYACSNKLYRSGPLNGNWKEDNYQSTCFHYHDKKCVVCSEQNIVAVHHLDENHSNNNPSNLIPLCPTHHQYWHSRFKHLIEQQIIDYITEWKRVHSQDGETRTRKSLAPKASGIPGYPTS